jgi:cytochrome c556
MRRSGKFVTLAGLAALWACAMDASAQSSKAVEDRQAIMKSNGAALAAITAFYKENKGTMADVERHLAALQDNATKAGNPALWPRGTSAGELGAKATGAKPDIWDKMDDFRKATANFDAEVKKLAATVKSGDKAAAEAAVGTFPRTACGTCHQPFRARRET